MLIVGLVMLSVLALAGWTLFLMDSRQKLKAALRDAMDREQGPLRLALFGRRDVDLESGFDLAAVYLFAGGL